LITIGLFLYLCTNDYPSFYYDSAHYWNISSSFWDNGFSLLHFKDALRGYLFPLSLAVPFHVSNYDPTTAFGFVHVMNAILAGLLFGVVAPHLWQSASNGRPLSAGRRAAFVGCGLVLWHGHFAFPLSDFPALLCFLTALWLIFKPEWWPRFFLVGLFLGASVNIRTMYLLAAPPLVGLLTYRMAVLERMPKARIAAAIAVVVVGFAVVSLPQYLINLRHHGRATPLVLNQDPDYWIENKPNLLLWQLNAGLHAQKYETSIDPRYAEGMMVYRDPMGEAMLQQEGIKVLKTTREYLAFAFHHPVNMIALLTRHLFNGLDIVYPMLYIRKVHSPSLVLRIFNYTVIFGAMLVALFGSKRGPSMQQILLVSILLAPCLAVIPFAIECRYLLPLHLLLYAIGAFGWPSHWDRRVLYQRRTIGVAAAYILFVGSCLALSAQVQSSLDIGGKML
jgi:hypothetical protein